MENVKEKGPKVGPLKADDGSLPAIDPSLIEDVGGFLEDPEVWFRTPNAIFEGRQPIELLGTPEEARIRERIELAKLGMFT